MENSMRAALESGDLAGILAGWGADESYRCRYMPMCPYGHDHSDHTVTLDLFRWGTGMWMLAGNNEHAYVEATDTEDAASKLAQMVDAFRNLAARHNTMAGTEGVLTVEHMVAGVVSLVDTPFEDTVIPASLPHGWGTV
jgi:hypothetical protein